MKSILNEQAINTILDIIYRELQAEKDYWEKSKTNMEYDYTYVFELLNAYRFITLKHTTYLKRYANIEILKDLIEYWESNKKFDLDNRRFEL